MEATEEFFSALGWSEKQLVKLTKPEEDSAMYAISESQFKSDLPANLKTIRPGSVIVRMIQKRKMTVVSHLKQKIDLALPGSVEEYLTTLIDKANRAITNDLDQQAIDLGCEHVYFTTEGSKLDVKIQLFVDADNEFQLILSSGKHLHLNSVTFSKDNVFGIDPIVTFGSPKKKTQRTIFFNWLAQEVIGRLPTLVLFVEEGLDRLLVTGQQMFSSCPVAFFSQGRVEMKFKNRLDTMNTISNLTFKLDCLDPSDLKFDITDAKVNVNALFEIKLK